MPGHVPALPLPSRGRDGDVVEVDGSLRTVAALGRGFLRFTDGSRRRWFRAERVAS